MLRVMCFTRGLAVANNNSTPEMIEEIDRLDDSLIEMIELYAQQKAEAGRQ